jgi:hypothetical protein
MFHLSATGRIASLLLLSLAATAPAHAVTVLLGGPAANAASVSRSDGGLSLSITAKKFTVAPGALANISQFTGNGLVSVSAPGLGVAGGASAPQIDTNQANAREALLVSSTKPIKLSALKLSYVDANDTLQLYGVGSDGSLTAIGFGGNIRTGLGGAATFVNSNANSGTTALDFVTQTAAYSAFLFTTRVGGDVYYGGDLGQGYRLDSISADAVPEPATWAMFIAGFGLIGAAVRRRRAIEA